MSRVGRWSVQRSLRSFELYVFPKLGEIPAEQITLHMWLDLLEEQFKQSPSITDRILMIIVTGKQIGRAHV